MKIDPSLYAVFRVVAIMIANATEPHEREVAWFEWLMNRYNLGPEQRGQLLEDLRNPASVKQIFPQVNNEHDRQRLLSWLKIAMNIGGKPSIKEQDFYWEVMQLDARTLPHDANREKAIAEALVDQDYRVQFWKDLGEIGSKLKRPVRWWHRFW